MHSPDSNMKVSELMCPNGVIWDCERLQQMVVQEDIHAVKLIKPSITGNSDMVRWHYTKDGEYNVKSGYHFIHTASHLTIPQKDQKLFQTLWRMKIPPKLKHFWWRVLHNALPVAANLKRRGLRIDNVCQVCGNEEETVHHMMYCCPVAREVWELSPAQHLPGNTDSNSLFSNIRTMVDLNLRRGNRDCSNTPLFPFIGWRIWKMQNNLVFNGRKEMIPKVIEQAIRDHKQWIEAQDKEAEWRIGQQKRDGINKKQNSRDELFRRPHQLFCFVDGSWTKDDERAGIGWKLASKDGQSIMSGLTSTEPISTALETEAYALREAVYQVKKHGYRNVAFVFDSENLYKSLKTCLEGHCSGGNQNISCYCEDINKMAQEEIDLGFVFYIVPRDIVYDVDIMAKQARQRQSSYVIKWDAL